MRSGQVSVKRWVSLRTPVPFPLPQGSISITLPPPARVFFLNSCLLDACCDPRVTKQARTDLALHPQPNSPPPSGIKKPVLT